MSMRYTGKNWKEVRKVWRKDQNTSTLDAIVEAKRIVKEGEDLELMKRQALLSCHFTEEFK